MQVFAHLKNEETATVTLRLSHEQVESLREYMHVSNPAEKVHFPHGVRLDYRSRGWYRLEASNTYRAVEKLTLALSIVRKWHREFERERLAETRRLLLLACPNITIVAHTGNNYMVQESNSPTIKSAQDVRLDTKSSQMPMRPASEQQLSRLVQLFAH